LFLKKRDMDTSREKHIFSVLYPAENGTHWGTFSTRKKALKALKFWGIKKKNAYINTIIVDYRLTSKQYE
jgi:hypothetical protein